MVANPDITPVVGNFRVGGYSGVTVTSLISWQFPQVEGIFAAQVSGEIGILLCEPKVLGSIFTRRYPRRPRTCALFIGHRQAQRKAGSACFVPRYFCK